MGSRFCIFLLHLIEQDSRDDHKPLYHHLPELGYAEKNKPIAAICHGAQLLAAADVLRGKGCSAYPAVEPEVKLAGGKYVEKAMDQVHADGNLVTAPAWPAHPAWLAKFLQLLGTRIEP